jgi:hypothetical protein
MLQSACVSLHNTQLFQYIYIRLGAGNFAGGPREAELKLRAG